MISRNQHIGDLMNNVEKLKAILDLVQQESMGPEVEPVSESFRFCTHPNAGFIELEHVVKQKATTIKRVELPAMEVLHFRCFLDAWGDHSDRDISSVEDAIKLFDLLVDLSKLAG